jgi:hypothetical protein
MSGKRPRPTKTDRLISHVAVGLAAGALVGTKKGLGGFIVGALVGAGAHAALDAPTAQLVADVRKYLTDR